MANSNVTVLPKEEDSADEQAVLPGLFSGLDFVLRLLAARGVKPTIAVVRKDVENITSRDFSDFRLSGILGLVGPSMIDARWVGTGRDAKLEIFQRAQDGKERPPAMDELGERKAEFTRALATAIQNGKIPRSALPVRPLTLSTVISQKTEAPGVPRLPEPLAAKPVSSKGLSADQRREALLARVRVRETAGNSLDAKEYEKLRQRMVVCDNAKIAHSVLQSLFARGEGRCSAASEAEVLHAMCSASFGMQSVKTLSKLAAQEAVQVLSAVATEWFSTEAGVHVPGAKYFRRLPQGRAVVALAALQTARQALESQLRSLCELAKRQQEQPRSAQLLVDVADVEVAEASSSDNVVSPAHVPVTSSVAVPLAAVSESQASLATPCSKATLIEAFPIGAIVEAHSLNNISFNGKRGMVLGFDGDRVRVELQLPAEIVKLKPMNLEVVAPARRRMRQKTCVA